MRNNKALLFMAAILMVISLITVMTTITYAQPPDFSCKIVETGTEYANLDDALSAASSGQTIQLLTDIAYGSAIMAYNKSVTLDVNGHALTVSVLDQTCIYAHDGYDLNITDSAGGGSVALYASGGSSFNGLSVRDYGSEIHVDVPTSVNVTGNGCYGIYALGGGIVSLTGDITVTGTDSYAAGAFSGVYGSLITIDGEINSTNYINANGAVFTEPEQCILPTTKDGYLTFKHNGDSANPQSTVWVKEITYVAEVDGVPYETLDEAITVAAVDWDTIKLLADIDYSGGLAPTFDMYINLNGYNLNVVNDSGIGLYADGRDISIFGEGEFNITGTSYGVYACDGGSAEITNVEATAVGGKAVYVGDSSCSVTVLGNATANAENGIAVYTGDSPNCKALIHGDVSATGTNGIGAWATSGGKIEIRGDINATNYLKLGGEIKTQAQFNSAANGYHIYTDTISEIKVKHVVCSIGATEYKWLSDALAAAADGDTITLLSDIRYESEIVLNNKDLHFDLATYKLDVGRTGSEGAITVDGGTLTIDDSNGGELNIFDGGTGVKVLNGGNATITSISGLNRYGIIGESGGSVTVKGNISVLDYIGSGMHLSGGASAHVLGNIYTREGIMVQQTGTVAIIEGNISATSGPGVYIGSGGSVTVHGNITSNNRGVSGGSGGGTVHVMGNVTSTLWEGVQAYSNANIVIDGNVISEYGLDAWGEGTTIHVKGNTTTTNNDYFGAHAYNGAEITIDGTITASNYVKIGDTIMNKEDGVFHGRHILYTDEESTVRLKGYEFYKEDFESGSLDGWAAEAGWSLTNSLNSPSTTAHSGSWVAKFNSATLAPDTTSRYYQTKPLNFSVGTAYWLEFWMYHDSVWEHDTVTIQVSTDGGNNWANLNTYFRYSENEGWKKEAISLAAYAGQPDVRLAFLGYSDGGNNIYIDDITVSHECLIDGCSLTEAYGGFVPSEEIDGETYYHIANPQQLAHISNHLDLNYIQTEDIDLTGIDWTPIGITSDTPFRGVYDGNGHEITNLNVNQLANSTNKSGGLFGALVGNAAIKNLSVSGNVTYRVNWYATSSMTGGIAAYMLSQGGNSPLIDNCSFTGNVTAIAQVTINNNIVQSFAGGIVGYSRDGIIKNCSYQGGNIIARTITSSGSTTYAHAGGIAGTLSEGALLINCYTSAGADISAKDSTYANAGGIAGQLQDSSKVSNCYSAGSVSVSSSDTTRIGGITGLHYGSDNQTLASYWLDSCGAASQVGSDNATANTGKMTEANLKATSFGDTLNNDLNTVADTTLFKWEQVTGNMPTLSDIFWAPQPPPSGGGGGGSSAPAIIVTTQQEGNTITNRTEISSTTTGQTAAAKISTQVVDALLNKASSAGGNDKGDLIELAIDTDDDINKLQASLSQKDFAKIADETDASLGITSQLISIVFDGKAMETISSADKGGTVVVSAGIIDNSQLSKEDQAKVKGRRVYDLTVTNGESPVTNFNGGHAVVTIPYTLQPGENPNAVVIYYLSADGTLKTVRGHYCAELKSVIFKTNHFSKFVVGYNSVEFADVSENAWYKNAIQFIAARGITSGTGDNTFSPNAKLTRGQFVVLLINAYQLNSNMNSTTPQIENFADAGNTYYTKYLHAAKSMGIINGVGNNLFAPQKEITRQEMFVMLYNALKVIDEIPTPVNNKQLSDFNDAATVANWANQSISSLVKAGIVGGYNNGLHPNSTTTRGEIAQVLYNLLAN